MVKLNTVNPCTIASGIQMSGWSNRISAQVAIPRIANCRDRDREVPQRLLPVQVPHLLARNGRAQLGAQRARMLGVVVAVSRCFHCTTMNPYS